jgi:PAS domain-containing protein
LYRRVRERADERIQEQAALMDPATDAILGCDTDGRITFWNRSDETIDGWAAGEAIGRDMEAIAPPVGPPGERAGPVAGTELSQGIRLESRMERNLPQEIDVVLTDMMMPVTDDFGYLTVVYVSVAEVVRLRRGPATEVSRLRLPGRSLRSLPWRPGGSSRRLEPPHNSTSQKIRSRWSPTTRLLF